MAKYDVGGIEFEQRRSGYFCNGIYLWDINYIFEGTLTLMNDGSPTRMRILLGPEIFAQLKYRVLPKHDYIAYSRCIICERTTPKTYRRDYDDYTCESCLIE
jgi:hypothetical protein